MSRAAPPSMGAGPWPTCCGKPMWFGPRGYACECSTPVIEREPMTVDLFAGPGGWEVGARLAGYAGPIVGLEMAATACATGRRAGHTRIRCDVAQYPTAPFVGRTDGLIASPPCPTFSPAGDGAGKVDTPNVIRLIADYAAGRTPGDYVWADDRSALTAQPMRWAAAVRPRWIALEQVPPVLPIWQYTAARLADRGYRVWTGVLSAERFGVPSTRPRALLIASLEGPAGPPVPTHQSYQTGADALEVPDLFGDPLPAPVSMADACGWPSDQLVGFPRRADTATNKAARVVHFDGVAYRARDLRSASAPAFVLTEKVRSWHRWSATGTDPVRVTLDEAAVLQGFPPGYPWQGRTQGELFKQVGDAVPPPLAAAVFGSLVASSRREQERAA